MGRLVIVLLSSILLGCATTKTVEVPVNVPVVCNNAPKPLPLNMLPIKWKLTKDENNLYVLGLDGKEYSNLAINMENIAGYIVTQKEVINYYDTCIKRHNKKGSQ